MTSCSTPSTRYRIRRSRSIGSRWMSEARSARAWLIRRFTILTMGPSSTATATSSSLPSSACSDAALVSCSTDSSKWLYLRTAASMSTAVATTGWTSRPVMVRMSSTANRFAGSAIATTSFEPSYPMGRARYRRATCSGMSEAAPGSIIVSPRSTNGRPTCLARAATRSDSLTTPRSTRTLPSNWLRWALASRAWSSSSVVSSPSSMRICPSGLVFLSATGPPLSCHRSGRSSSAP